MKKSIVLFTLLASLIAPSVSLAGPADLEYFKQFIYSKTVDNTDPDYPKTNYRFLMAGFPDHFTATDGSRTNFDSSLYLYEDGKFEMFYRESKPIGEPKPDGSQPMMPNGCKHITGTWSVPDTQLVLDSVAGFGDRLMEDSQNKVNFSWKTDIISAGLSGQTFSFNYGFSNFGPEMEFCF